MVRWYPAVVGACVLLAAPAASAEEDAKYVKLVHAATGRVLAVEDNSDEAGAKTVLAKDDGSEGQQWQLVKDGDHYKLVNRKSKKVLDVSGDSTEEGGEIIQWDDKAEGNDNQRWSWVGDGKERRLKAKSSGLVLDVGDGVQVVQKKSDDQAKGQLWRVVEAK
jgi:Ricin-type beta-trefoil lectin domain-like